MPEGPEVKLSADLIRPLASGRIITSVDFPQTSRYHNNYPNGFTEFTRYFSYQNKSFSCRIADVNCKGKLMYWSIANGWYVLITYGMTGQLSPNPGKHVCMKVSLDDDPLRIYFNDPRHFGTIKFTNNNQELEDKLNELGWDPLSDNKAPPWLKSKVCSSEKPIGQLLMDQKLFSGVGNYLRAEALYTAGISPWRSGKLLSDTEFDALCQALTQIMQTSYQHQGATIRTYKTAFGEEGKYSSCFKVYDQKQDPLGNPIIKETTPEGRTIHWCPNMQQ